MMILLIDEQQRVLAACVGRVAQQRGQSLAALAQLVIGAGGKGMPQAQTGCGCLLLLLLLLMLRYALHGRDAATRAVPVGGAMVVQCMPR